MIYLRATTFLIINIVPSMRTIAIGRDMNQVWMSGITVAMTEAMMNETNETAATVIA